MKFIYILGHEERRSLPIEFIKNDTKESIEEYLGQVADAYINEYVLKMKSKGYLADDIVIENALVEIYAVRSEFFELHLTAKVRNQHYSIDIDKTFSEHDNTQLILITYKHRKSLNNCGYNLAVLVKRDIESYERHLESLKNPIPSILPKELTLKPNKKSFFDKILHRS